MKFAFTNENLKKNVEDLATNIFEFCKSEVEKINKLSESSRRDAKSIILHKIKNLPIWHELGISLHHTHDHVYDKYTVDWWLENLVTDLVVTKKVIKPVSEYIALKGEYPDLIPSYEIEHDGAHLVIDLKNIPKDNKFILIEYTEVYFTYNKSIANILDDIDNIGVLDSNHNFCLLFYLMRNRGELIRTHARKVSDVLQVMGGINPIQSEQIKCIKSNLFKLNGLLSADLMTKNDLTIAYNDQKKYNSFIIDLGNAYFKIVDYYLFDMRPDNVKIVIVNGIEIHIYTTPIVVYTDILDM